MLLPTISDSCLRSTPHRLLNLLVGALANLGKIKPYGEARFEIEGGKQLVLTAGAYINLGAGKSAIR